MDVASWFVCSLLAAAAPVSRPAQPAAIGEVYALLYVERQETAAQTRELRDRVRKEFANSRLYTSAIQDIEDLPLFHNEKNPGNWLAKNLQAEYLAGTGALRLTVPGGSPGEQKAILHAVLRSWLDARAYEKKFLLSEIESVKEDRRDDAQQLQKGLAEGKDPTPGHLVLSAREEKIRELEVKMKQACSVHLLGPPEKNPSPPAAPVEVYALIYVERQETAAQTRELRAIMRKDIANEWVLGWLIRDIEHLPLFHNEKDAGKWLAQNLQAEYLAGTGVLRLSLCGGTPGEQKIILRTLVNDWLKFRTAMKKMKEQDLIVVRKDRRRCEQELQGCLGEGTDPTRVRQRLVLLDAEIHKLEAQLKQDSSVRVLELPDLSPAK